MNKIKLLGLSIIVLSLFSCVEKFDYNNMDKDLKFGTSLVIPVGYSTLTASEVLHGMSDSAILVDKDKNMIYYHITEQYHFPVNEFLRVDLGNSKANQHQPFAAFFGGAVFPITVSAANVATINSQITPINGMFDFGLDKYEGASLSRRADFIRIHDGKLRLRTTLTNVTGLSPAGAKIKVELSFFTDATTEKKHTFMLDANTQTQEIDISNWDVTFLQNERPASKIPFVMKSTLICEGADNIVFASGADVSVKVDFVDLNVTLLKGWIGESYTIASDTIVNNLPKNLFKSKTIENNDLYFHNPVFTFNIEHNAGVPLVLNIDRISCSNDNGQTASANFNGSPSKSVSLNRATSIGGKGKTTVVCDRDNGATHGLFRVPKPTKVDYSFSLKFDRTVAAEDLTNNIQHFLLRPTYLDLDVDVKLPFHFDPSSNIKVVNDTIKNVNIDSVLNKYKLTFDEVEIMLAINNHVPVYGKVSLVFEDKNGTKLHTIDGIDVQSANIDANGIATSAKETRINLSLTSNAIYKIRQSNKILLSYTLKGNTDNDPIHIKATDWLKATLGIYVKGAIRENLDTLLKK